MRKRMIERQHDEAFPTLSHIDYLRGADGIIKIIFMGQHDALRISRGSRSITNRYRVIFMNRGFNFGHFSGGGFIFQNFFSLTNHIIVEKKIFPFLQICLADHLPKMIALRTDADDHRLCFELVENLGGFLEIVFRNQHRFRFGMIEAENDFIAGKFRGKRHRRTAGFQNPIFTNNPGRPPLRNNRNIVTFLKTVFY